VSGSRQFSDRPTTAISRVLIAVVETGGGMLLLVFPVECGLEFAAMQKQGHFRYTKLRSVPVSFVWVKFCSFKMTASLKIW
jgi:hypothetical protein